MDCEKTEERSVKIFTPYEWSFSLVFWEKERLVGATHSTGNFGSTGSSWSKIADFKPIFARSASAVIPRKNNYINTNRKSTTRFPMSLKWSFYVAPKPPKGAQKRKTTIFCLKSRFAWRRSSAKFLFVKTCQWQSCKAFIGLNMRSKMIGGDVPFYLKFWVKLAALERNRRFSNEMNEWMKVRW